jgi:NifU-like protein involved in Fe-S cluster formation
MDILQNGKKCANLRAQKAERIVHYLIVSDMIYSHEVQQMCCVTKGPDHGPAPIPQEGKWVKAKQVSDISGLTHGVGWCAPQQGACKLTLNVKDGIIQEALVETIGCSGMTHSAAMASEILPGKTILEALNTDLVCDAINTAMRELFLQISYGRTQSAFSEGGLPSEPAWKIWARVCAARWELCTEPCKGCSLSGDGRGLLLTHGAGCQ